MNFNLNNIISFGSRQSVGTSTVFNDKASSEKTRISSESKLERTPASDSVRLTKEAVKALRIKEKEFNTILSTDEKLAKIKKNKMLPDEVLYFLAPQNVEGAPKKYTPIQIRIIDAADKKVDFFKSVSKELDAHAKKYGPQIHEDMKKVFGGDEGLGKYVVLRMKDSVSIFDKLVKEFNSDRIYPQVFDIFAKKTYGKPYAKLDDDEKGLIKLCIQDGEVKLEPKDYKIIENALKNSPEEYLANKHYKKAFCELSKEEKEYIKGLPFKEDDAIDKMNTRRERDEAYAWVKDLVGTRLVLPTGNRAEMTKVEKYLDKAILSGDLKISRISNYRGNCVLPFLKQEAAKRWKDAFPGIMLVDSSKVRKKNGYTTTQMNILHKVEGKARPVLGEFQIRTEEMNYINDVEHYIYDVLEKKDITKGIPELKKFFDSCGFAEAVKEVFVDPQSPDEFKNHMEPKETRYMNYEHAMFAYTRDKETPTYKFGKIEKPIMEDYGLGEYENILSFDALKNINEKAKIIKEKYGKDSGKNNQ